MSNPKHTPLPWRESDKASDAIVADHPTDGPFGNKYEAEYGGYLIAESVTPSNRRFICTAANHHDTLVAALSALVTALEAEASVSSGQFLSDRNLHIAFDQAEQALQSVTEAMAHE